MANRAANRICHPCRAAANKRASLRRMLPSNLGQPTAVAGAAVWTIFPHKPRPRVVTKQVRLHLLMHLEAQGAVAAQLSKAQLIRVVLQ